MGKTPRRWTPEEDVRLKELVEETHYSYAEIGRMIERHADTVRLRYNKIRDVDLNIAGITDPLLAALEKHHGRRARDIRRSYDDGILL